jgi:hypothetical protein
MESKNKTYLYPIQIKYKKQIKRDNTREFWANEEDLLSSVTILDKELLSPATKTINEFA